MAEAWDTYFQPGETLLWEGAPLAGVHGRGKIIGLGLFGLPFLAIGIATVVTGLSELFKASSLAEAGFGLLLAAFSLPFTGIGALLVFGLWFAAAQAHRRVRYALSTRAAYVAQSWWKNQLDCYPILPISATGLEKGRRSDTVWFHVRSDKGSDGDVSITRIGFENIADGGQVFQLIRSIQMGKA